MEMAKDYQWHFDVLEGYIKAMGYQVVHTDCDSWSAQQKIICNNKNRTLENRVIYLAHECGHALFYAENQYEYMDILPGLNDGNRISEIEQEVLAWERGLRILKRLSIPVNLKKLAQIKNKCLKEYIQ